MKANFKPMGVAAAVATAAVAYAGTANAQTMRSIGNLGDAAIVPYYTVQDDWVTGVHIINSGPTTQVVKLRLRRAGDSADALDFNLIMSPYDEWVGSIDDSSGNIVMTAGANQDGVRDTTCTAPVRADGTFPMPDIYREGAEEGYIEVIGMGSPATETAPIAIGAKHTAGVPLDCTAVASNFFANASLTNGGLGVPTTRGNLGNAASAQAVPAANVYAAAGSACAPAAPATTPAICQNAYVASAPSLKVSYFVRDAASGIEFGGDAVHLTGFNQGTPWMTNQQTGLFSGDPYGFDYPDLNGGPWIANDGGAARVGAAVFNQLRDPSVLGVSQLLNDWSIAAARGVSTDWVITMPGQYVMLDYFVWLTQGLSNTNCGRVGIPATGQSPVPLCDYRDIPVVADLTLYDREEGVIAPEEGDLVISPAPPGTTNTLLLPNEVNVVEWTDGTNTPVLGSEYNITVDSSVLGESGWASLSVSTATGAAGNAAGRLCEFNISENVTNAPSFSPIFDTNGIRSVQTCSTLATGATPIVGFVAWERSFPQNPEGNYGRLIDHSFIGS